MEGSLVAYKVFSNGSVLNASEINENLMNQSVAVFTSASARNAAIPSPLEGQLTYLEDTNRYESYNGSAWISPFGSTLITNTSFSATTSLIIANCFSSAYEIYDVYVRTTAGGQTPIFQMRAGATTQTTSYASSVIFWNGSAVTGTNRATSSFASFGNNANDLVKATFANPFEARTTSYLGQATSSGSNVGVEGGFLNTTTSYDSLVLGFGNSSTGNIAIYGMRKNV
jgi:hypothetical protein